MRRFLCLAVLLLAACQMRAPTNEAARPEVSDEAQLSGLTAEPIAVSALDGTSAAGTGEAAARVPVADTIPVQVPDAKTPRPKPRPAVGAAPKADAKAKAAHPPGPTPELTPEPAPPVSPEQAACEKAAGQWAASDGGGNVCVHRTRDAGKSCRKKGDCQGECLARSNTCAPISPLMGCNDILQANGSEVTLCLQ